MVSFFGRWTNRHTEPHMWIGAGCTYAPVRYQHTTAVALVAQYIGMVLGEYVHLTLGNRMADPQASARIDQMLNQKMPHETKEDAPFRRRTQTAKVAQEINTTMSFLVEPDPIDIRESDATIGADLDGHVEVEASSTLPTTHRDVAVPDNDEPPANTQRPIGHDTTSRKPTNKKPKDTTTRHKTPRGGSPHPPKRKNPTRGHRTVPRNGDQQTLCIRSGWLKRKGPPQRGTDKKHPRQGKEVGHSLRLFPL